MNAFQSMLLSVVARHPGTTADELALAIGLDKLTWSRRKYLRRLEDTGAIMSKRVRLQGRIFVKVYRTR